VARVPRRDELDEFFEKFKEELNEYAIGDLDLDKALAPLLDACSRVAKTADEFRQCVVEAASTLKSVAKRVK